MSAWVWLHVVVGAVAVGLIVWGSSATLASRHRHGPGCGRAVKRRIVGGVEAVCSLLDAVPTFERGDNGWRFYRHGGWGCRWRIGAWSWRLDEKWQTGVWSVPKP